MRNNKYQSKSSHAGMFNTGGVFLQPYAGFKIVQGSFCGRFCVPRPSPRDACQFCFTIALEAAVFAGDLSCFAAV